MKRKRDKLRIIYDILGIIRDNKNSIKYTPLLNKSGLSSNNFNEHFKFLKDKGFIKEIRDKKGKRFITLTDKGFDYLTEYKRITLFIEEFAL